MFNREPTVILGALSEAIRQLLPALIVFGFLDWSGEKTAAANIMVGVVMGFLTVLFTRSQTVPTQTANRQIAEGVASPAGTSVESVIEAEAANIK